MDRNLSEGWAQLGYLLKYHYFNENGSLCGRYGKQEDAGFSPDIDNLKDDSLICKKCLRIHKAEDTQDG